MGVLFDLFRSWLVVCPDSAFQLGDTSKVCRWKMGSSGSQLNRDWYYDELRGIKYTNFGVHVELLLSCGF